MHANILIDITMCARMYMYASTLYTIYANAKGRQTVVLVSANSMHSMANLHKILCNLKDSIAFVNTCRHSIMLGESMCLHTYIATCSGENIQCMT